MTGNNYTSLDEIEALLAAQEGAHSEHIRAYARYLASTR